MAHLKKLGTEIVANVNLKPIHKFWATHDDFTVKNVTPERRKEFETFKDDTECQTHLAVDRSFTSCCYRRQD